jgi:hypothetical protein
MISQERAIFALFVFTSGSMKLDPPRDLRFGTSFGSSEIRGHFFAIRPLWTLPS